MSSALSKLEIVVLRWVSADYEMLTSIEENVAKYVGRNVSHEEIQGALIKLQERGLVDSYIYNQSTQKYQEKSVDQSGTMESYWWLATLAGQRMAGMEPDGP